MPGLWAGCMACLFFARGVGFCYLVVCLFPVCGGLVCVLFLVCPVCGLGLFGWVACWHRLDSCIGLTPLLLCF